GGKRLRGEDLMRRRRTHSFELGCFDGDNAAGNRQNDDQAEERPTESFEKGHLWCVIGFSGRRIPSCWRIVLMLQASVSRFGCYCRSFHITSRATSLMKHFIGLLPSHFARAT